jgi:DNase/tRNase domain of colicin-like bacteriocin
LPSNLRGNSISDYEQFKESTKQLKREILAKPSAGNIFTKEQIADIMAEKDKIRGLTWHHHQDGVRLQLVDREVHAKTGHDGGRKNTGGRPK